MPLRVLIIPDKFKGSLTAQEAAQAIARGWKQVRPGDRLGLIPMSDGGDGFGQVMRLRLGALPRRSDTVNAAGLPCVAEWYWEPETGTAILESAQVVGLAQLPRGRYHPFDLDTRGLASVLREIRRAGARRCLVGIGGSATNDGGFGLARSMGWRFLDDRRRPITAWTELHRLESLAPPRRRAWPKLQVAVDVQNRLLGPAGCTRVYGPQKGLGPEDFPRAEAALRRLAAVAARTFGRRSHLAAGAGAAGGLGFGFRAFLEADLVSGFQLFAKEAGLQKLLDETDLVITGEGRIDRSTLMGKGVGELAQWAHRKRIPVLAMAGQVEDPARTGELFEMADALTSMTSAQKAMAAPGHWLELLAAAVARRYRSE